MASAACRSASVCFCFALRGNFVVVIQVFLQDSARIVNRLLQVVNLLHSRRLRRALLLAHGSGILRWRVWAEDIRENDNYQQAHDGKEDLPFGGVADTWRLDRLRVWDARCPDIVGVRGHEISPLSPA